MSQLDVKGTGVARRLDIHQLISRLRSSIPFLALILLIVIFSILEPTRFLTARNFAFVLSQSAILSMVGFGLTFVIVAGYIDLSVGSVAALSGMLGMAALSDFGLIPGLLVGTLVGLGCGLFNGLVFTYVRIPSFVVTLGMLTIARGLTQWYSEGSVIIVEGPAEQIGRFPNIYFIVIALFVLCTILFNFTRFGRYTQGMGGDERVAVLTGLPVQRVKVLIFTLCGSLAGFSGMVLASRVGAASPTSAIGLELDAIAAVVVGGTPLSGGVGHIYNALLGALIIAIIGNALVIMGIRSEVQLVVKGLVLILAIAISLERERIGVIK